MVSALAPCQFGCGSFRKRFAQVLVSARCSPVRPRERWRLSVFFMLDHQHKKHRALMGGE